ncbi:Gamma-aminobutyric acid type B receptor subunit 2 [Collichthys lucidus]|uniref:Gamma-aminobutyric acid type B receptor subunit 2 n=1 Tax=Collichthys lucidus TaxID=240159 RepID=A0A4U5V4H2_COLLU|nr:Gamma-aminobutyric acid type B receptor subunit 2 [Collichthys lucidus]
MERGGPVEVFRLLVLLLCWLVVGPVLAQVRHPLPVLWVMPVSSEVGKENLTAAVAPAVRLALQDLKREPPPLGNLRSSSSCWTHRGVSICDGADRSRSARSQAGAGVLCGLAPSLSDRKRYGNLFSTVPSGRALNQATVKLLQHLKWSRVGVITQEGAGLSEMKKDVIAQLLDADLQVVSTPSLSEDVCASVRKMKVLHGLSQSKQKVGPRFTGTLRWNLHQATGSTLHRHDEDRDVRIIIGQFKEDSAAEVFCCAYRLNLFGARYQWIIADGGVAGWRLGRQAAGCTAHSVLLAADGSIRLQIRQLSHTNAPGVSGRTPQDYQDSYRRQLIQDGSKVSPLHTFAYDAVWVAARALSQVMEAVKHREKYSAQRDASVSGDQVHKMLLEALRLMDHLLRFTGPGPARDRTLVLEQRRHVGLLLYSIVSAAAAVTIIITLIVLFLAVLCREHWLLTSSGDSQDKLLLLGILLSSSSVLISGLDGASLSNWTSEVLCSVRLWTLSVGHTVGFAVLFNRTWRIYSVHSVRVKQQQQQSRLQRSGCVVFWMFLLDVFVLTSWQILDPLRRVVLQHDLESDPADPDVKVRLSSEHCSSTNMELWLTAVYGYKVPLLVRSRVFRGLEHLDCAGRSSAVGSKHLALSMFAVAVFSVSGVSASLLTSNNPPVQFCLSSILILSCNICTLSWLFGTKFLCTWPKSSELQSEAAEDEDEDEDQVNSLNQQLKSQSAQLDAEIEAISRELSAESAGPDPQLHHRTGERHHGEVRSVMWTHVVQVCSEDRNSERKPSSPDGIISPEHFSVGRRLSMQLPILHHSYLPAVGGVSASSSEAFVHSDLPMSPLTTSCTPEPTIVLNQSDGSCD